MAWPLPSTVHKLDRLARRIREKTARRSWPTTTHDLDLYSPVGHRLPCRLHLPEHQGPFPAVLLVPGGLDGARSVESPSCVLPPQRLARAGFAVLVFTPSGREETPGPADCNGPLHQAECALALASLLQRPEVDPDRVAILSLSFGLVMALGALHARKDLVPKVRLLLDWEGPGSRRWFQATGIGAEPTDEEFWRFREGVELIRGVPVPYRRFQSRWDHIHGPDTDIGWEMAEAAVAADCPQVWLNDHPAPLPARERVLWRTGLRLRQGVILLQWLIEATRDAAGAPAR